MPRLGSLATAVLLAFANPIADVNVNVNAAGIQVGQGSPSGAPYSVAQKPARKPAQQQQQQTRFPACNAIDGFCPDAHPIMYGDPVPKFFKCKSSADCNEHQCVQGKCECKGGNLFLNCGAMVMYHREWAAIKHRPKLAAGERVVPHPMTYLTKGDYSKIPEGTISHPTLSVSWLHFFRFFFFLHLHFVFLNLFFPFLNFFGFYVSSVSLLHVFC